MEQYFTKKPTSVEKETFIEYRIKGADFRFVSGNGVFSKSGVDFGTNLLLNVFLEELSQNEIHSLGSHGKLAMLDAGCGIGIVGVVLANTFKEAQITMFDVNERATMLAQRNLVLNGAQNAKVLLSDLYQNISENFDYILSNPPIRAGKETIFQLYEGSFAHLKSNGAFYAVIQKKQGAESTQKRLTELFGNCTVLDKKAGYRILKCVKGSVL